MTQEHNDKWGVGDWLMAGLVIIAGGIMVADSMSQDGSSDSYEEDDLSSSYPPEEDAMNHRYPGSYGSKTGG